MDFAESYLGGGNDLVITANAAMSLILKLGFAFVPARYRRVQVDGGLFFIESIGKCGCGGIVVAVDIGELDVTFFL
jgi:hypothetical protein